MSNLDFEKTQIWAKNLVQASDEKTSAEPVQTPVKPIPAMKKPEMKQLSKEEKLILAAGGALAVGLGAIVISSLDDAPAPVAATPKADVAVPHLVFGQEEAKAPELPEPEPMPSPLPVTPSVAPPSAAGGGSTRPEPHTPPAEQPAREEQHALLQIPDEPEVATLVTDEMTFHEAFGKAREEVGPAGLFAWKGTFYSTFTDREWEGVSKDHQDKWLVAAQPIIEPDQDETGDLGESMASLVQNVTVAERGLITWTGIDKNGDGQTEILMARIHGQAPMVLMDTDQDGILDTRYDFEASSGKTFASQIQPFAMTSADIENLEEVTVETDMGFFTNPASKSESDGLPVAILEDKGRYLVSTDSNHDKTIDTLTFLADGHGPLVGLDSDNDGQIEMGFVYNSNSQQMTAVEMEPLEEMSLESPELPGVFPTDDSFELTYEAPDLTDDEEAEDLNDPFFNETPGEDDYNAYS